MLPVQAILHWLLGGAVNIITIEAGLYFGENISGVPTYSSPQRHETEVECGSGLMREYTHTPSGRQWFREEGVELETPTHKHTHSHSCTK